MRMQHIQQLSDTTEQLQAELQELQSCKLHLEAKVVKLKDAKKDQTEALRLVRQDCAAAIEQVRSLSVCVEQHLPCDNGTSAEHHCASCLLWGRWAQGTRAEPDSGHSASCNGVGAGERVACSEAGNVSADRASTVYARNA